MAARIQDVVKANMVVVGIRLLESPDELERFRRTIGTDVQIAGAGLVANIPAGTTEPGHMLALNRDRITLDLSPSRSTINRDYPLRQDLSRLAEVAWSALGNSAEVKLRPQVFGFNMEAIFDQDSNTPAFQYLSSRLFDVGSLGGDEWQFVGGSGRLIFEDKGRIWTFNLEPRFNDAGETRVFMGVNLHFGAHPLPDEQEIRGYLEDLWDNGHEFVNRLDDK